MTETKPHKLFFPLCLCLDMSLSLCLSQSLPSSPGAIDLFVDKLRDCATLVTKPTRPHRNHTGSQLTFFHRFSQHPFGLSRRLSCLVHRGEIRAREAFDPRRSAAARQVGYGGGTACREGHEDQGTVHRLHLVQRGSE